MDGNAYYEEDAAEKFVSYFSSFLGTCDKVFDIEDSISLFTNKLEADKALNLITQVTINEINDNLFSIKDNKAPWPDRYTSKFYKAAWKVVGDDTCSTIKEFFIS
ncbi:hypothetical protein Tco_1207747, partial [Tanacetum coccineum]